MNETQRAAAERLVDNMNLSLETWIEQAENLLRELAAEPVQEPVAWQLPGTDSFLTAVAKTHHGARAEAYSIPLYAAPQQQAEPVQEPKPTTASQFESVKEAKRAAEYELRYYRKMMDEKNAAEPQGEPVAHLYVGRDYGEELQDWEIDAEQGMCDKLNEQYYCNPQKLPLYTHPPQQPMRCPDDGGECGAVGYCRPEPQQRKPLSDEHVRQIVVEASTSWAFKRDGSTSMRIARAIECAHGITGEQK
ncbi:MAG: hypothetical protein IPK42_10590 [Betaproteobacteria bacterium]|nr:hypothetical protein [Betaproteobacteria bacterium]